MFDNIQYEGRWWLPEYPDNQVSGIITFNQEDGGLLKLTESFFSEGQRISVKYAQPEKAPIILGEVGMGKYITLVDCFSLTNPISQINGTSCQYQFHMLFINAHYESEAEILFKKLCAQISYLDTFTNSNPIVSKYDQESKCTSVVYCTPPKFEFDIDADVSGEIQEGVYTEYSSNSVSINTQKWLCIFSKSPGCELSFDFLFTYINSFVNLLNLAASRKSSIQKLQGVIDLADSGTTTIDIYYQQVEKPEKQKNLTKGEMLFTVEEFSSRGIDFFPIWAQFWQKNETIIQLYSLLYFKDRYFLDNKFLIIVQALEAFHGQNKDENEIPRDEFKSKLATIKAYIPNIEMQQWVLEKLNYSNKKSLQNMLTELFNEYSDLFSINIDNSTNFIRKVKNTRNNMSHGNKISSEFDTNLEFYYALQLLIVLLECHFLHEFGFEKEQINKKMEGKLKRFKKSWGMI